MKSRRLLLVAVIIGLVGVVLPGGRASSEETSCQSLASWYAEKPSQLDADSLAALRACVDQTINAQVRQPAQGSWPEDSDTQRRDRGAWPSPPAWSDGKIESKPWGRD